MPYSDIQPLSDREGEIMRLISQGKTRKAIASELSIQGDTVKKHLGNAYKKLGAANKTEALRIAATRGLF